MNKKAVFLFFISLAVILSSWWVFSETEFVSNKYGVSYVQVADYTINVSDKYDDGPYVSISNDELLGKKIVAGELHTQILPSNSLSTQFTPDTSTFSQVKKIGALSDIHGQYEVFVTLLRRHQIIDEQNNWSFGDGHLVIVGDIFDRGPKVVETLWLVYKLEQQAIEVSGKVHFLLGNHEYMVLQGDLRYLHPKYLMTEELLNVDYQQLFDTNTVLGRWLRSKSTVVKINQTLFVHGGLSEEFVVEHQDLDRINQTYRDSIGKAKKQVNTDPILSEFYNKNSPIWYRGYLRDEGIESSKIDSILSHFNAERIVVGHTSMAKVLGTNEGRVFAVDSSIKKGKMGEVLLLEEGDVYRGKFNGTKVKLN